MCVCRLFLLEVQPEDWPRYFIAIALEAFFHRVPRLNVFQMLVILCMCKFSTELHSNLTKLTVRFISCSLLFDRKDIAGEETIKAYYNDVVTTHV